MSLHLKNHVTFIHCLLLSVLVTGDVGCPDKCVCKWKSGKETVECVGSGLTAIPQGIAPGTQVLDLNHNEIPIIKNGLFSSLGITNLQKIFCSHCNLVAVEERSFLHLTNLVELDLSENLLRQVPSRSLELTKALMRLSLSANPIKLIKAKAFEHLKFVTNLDLSHCSIETIEMNGFFGMESLLELRLEGNHLSYLPGVNLFPRSVHLIELYGNPFQCDCRLLDFAHWIQQSGTPRTVEPQCLRPPRLANRTITSLALDSELACLPQVEAEIAHDGRSRGSGWATATKSSVGVTKAVEPGRRNVSLRCSVFAVPAAVVTWWRANRLVANSSVFEHLWEEQFYHIVEHRSNSHQLTSEFLILEVRPEDHGSFFCSAQNPAGVASVNFTIHVKGVESQPSLSAPGENKAALEEKTSKAKEDESVGSDKTDEDDDDDTMIKVEYILGFGAAVVIVLTIIIILILYLILQCRSRHKRRRAARAMGLHCDSNSGSFMERSTVDFIVPGEMELTKAVRSVSNSTMKTTTAESKSLLETSNTKLSDNGLSSSDDDFGTGGKTNIQTNLIHNQLQPMAAHHFYPYPRALNQNGMIPFGQPINWRHPYTAVPNGLMPGVPHPHWPPMRPMMPPTYRNPPPPTGAKMGSPSGKHGIMIDGSTGLPLCPCCGESNWHHFHFHPGMAQAYPGFYPPHPTSSRLPGPDPSGRPNSNLIAKNLNMMPNEPYQRPASAMYFHQTQFPDLLSGTGWRDQPVQSVIHTQAHGDDHFTGFHPFSSNYDRLQSSSSMDDLKSGALSDGEADRVNKRSNRRHQLTRRSSTLSMAGDQRWRLDSVAPHYVTISRASQQHLNQIGQKAWPGPGSHFKPGQVFTPRKLEKDSIRYSSQPFLSNGKLGSNILDFGSSPTNAPPPSSMASGVSLIANRQSLPHGPKTNSVRKSSLSGPPPQASKAQLERLNYKTCAVMPKFKDLVPQPRYQKPVSEQASHIANDEYLFPDLPPPPDALLDDDSGKGIHLKDVNLASSRSSSLDDLQQWVTSAADITAAANKAAAKAVNGFNTLPSNMASNYHPAYLNYPMQQYPSQNAHSNQIQLALNGVRRYRTPEANHQHSHHLRKGSGAVKVDLTFADKSIRRPDSAPDLAQEEVSSQSPHVSPFRQQSQFHRRPGGLKQKSLGRTSSVDGRKGGVKKIGCSPGKGKHVMFTGVSDADSPSETQDEEDPAEVESDATKTKSFDEDVWVLRQDNPELAKKRLKKQEFDSIPVSGIVVAQPQPCPATSPSQFIMKPMPPPPPPHGVPLGPIQAGAAMLAGVSQYDKPERPPKPAPPPRTTPQLPPRAPNPALQRAVNQPGGGQQSVSESPDEGYHEDGDPGSEVL